MGLTPQLHPPGVRGDCNIMLVVLGYALSGFYYAGRKLWVNGPSVALDLRTIERAAEAAREEDFGGMEIVACYRDPDCDFVLPLKRTGTSRGKAAFVGSQPVAIPPPPILAGESTPLPPIACARLT